jgi:uncharacterized glyoxalase superfamily protein PhnB
MSDYPPIVPNFAVSDPKASIAWFEKLGFHNEGAATTPDGGIMHAELTKGPVRVMLGPPMDGRIGAPGLGLYMKVDSGIDDYYASVKSAGVRISEDIADQFWGDRTFTVEHPDGYQIMFAQQVKTVTMEQVQEHLAQAAPV